MSASSFDVRKNAADGNITVAAGTNGTYRVSGDNPANGVLVADTSVTDFRIQPVVALKSRKSQYANGEFTKMKRYFTSSIPRLRASGIYTYDVIRIETEISPETAVVDAIAHELMCAQFLIVAGLSDFRRSGTIL